MWRIEQSIASLTLNDFSTKVLLDRPSLGLRDVIHRGTMLADCELMGPRLATADRGNALGPLTDAYVRGSDVLAAYRDDNCLTSQIYWRGVQRLDNPQAAGVELIFSVQTELLDIRPRLTFESRLCCDEVLFLPDPSVGFETLSGEHANTRSETGVFLFRLPGGQSSYVEMIHPVGFRNAIVNVAQANSPIANSLYEVLDEQLEKGVIRRNRIRGLLLERKNDEAVALQSYLAFVESAIPLDT